MNEDMTNNSNYGEFYGYKAGRDLWEQIEDFAYQTPTIWELLQYYWMEVLSLLIWLVVIILLIGYTNHKIKPLHG
jgi:ABC-2 type transport system permease protein